MLMLKSDSKIRPPSKTVHKMIKLILAAENYYFNRLTKNNLTNDQGSRIKDRGSRIKYEGSRIKYQVSRIKDQGPRIKDHGPCFCTNEHPRRDTDVISRLSKSTIEDLSFYIGFTMELLASRILDLVLAWMGILKGLRAWDQDCPNLQSKTYHFI